MVKPAAVWFVLPLHCKPEHTAYSKEVQQSKLISTPYTKNQVFLTSYFNNVCFIVFEWWWISKSNPSSVETHADCDVINGQTGLFSENSRWLPDARETILQESVFIRSAVKEMFVFFNFYFTTVCALGGPLQDVEAVWRVTFMLMLNVITFGLCCQAQLHLQKG